MKSFLYFRLFTYFLLTSQLCDGFLRKNAKLIILHRQITRIYVIMLIFMNLCAQISKLNTNKIKIVFFFVASDQINFWLDSQIIVIVFEQWVICFGADIIDVSALFVNENVEAIC